MKTLLVFVPPLFCVSSRYDWWLRAIFSSTLFGILAFEGYYGSGNAIYSLGINILYVIKGPSIMHSVKTNLLFIRNFHIHIHIFIWCTNEEIRYCTEAVVTPRRESHRTPQWITGNIHSHFPYMKTNLLKLQGNMVKGGYGNLSSNPFDYGC